MELQPPHPALFQLLKDSCSFCPSPLFLCHPGSCLPEPLGSRDRSSGLGHRTRFLPAQSGTLRSGVSLGRARRVSLGAQQVHGRCRSDCLNEHSPGRGPAGEEEPARRSPTPGPRGTLGSPVRRRKRPARSPPQGASRLISVPRGGRRSPGAPGGRRRRHGPGTLGRLHPSRPPAAAAAAAQPSPRRAPILEPGRFPFGYLCHLP